MIARTRVEKHAVALVEGPQADPVLLVHLLLLERNLVALVVPSAEPLGLFGVDNAVLVPLPQSELLDGGQSSFVPRVFHLSLVVDLGEEDRV